MKEKGFVTSALLYGILSVYIVLVVGTVSIIGNRKLANDKIKQSALDDVQYIETNPNCFNYTNNGSVSDEVIISDYRTGPGCPSLTVDVFIPEKDINGNKITLIGPEAFKNKNISSVTIKPNIVGINCNAFTGNNNVLFIIKGNMPSHITPSGVTCDDTSRWGATSSSVRQD